jgi:hypothetical protein
MMKQLEAKPVTGGVGVGLIASLCCGGSLVFGSIGLGALFGTIGLWRYIPQALAAGALGVVVINWLYYRRAAERMHQAGAGYPLDDVWRTMFASAALGIVAMVVSFVFLEWLNHAVVNAHRFMSRPALAQALIPGVANANLLYALASFSALALLWALPWPRFDTIRRVVPAVVQRSLRVGVFAATTGVVVLLVVHAMRGGSGGHGSGQQHTGTPQHGTATPRSH